jgi:hypothetical protein
MSDQCTARNLVPSGEPSCARAWANFGCARSLQVTHSGHMRQYAIGARTELSLGVHVYAATALAAVQGRVICGLTDTPPVYGAQAGPPSPQSKRAAPAAQSPDPCSSSHIVSRFRRLRSPSEAKPGHCAPKHQAPPTSAARTQCKLRLRYAKSRSLCKRTHHYDLPRLSDAPMRLYGTQARHSEIYCTRVCTHVPYQLLSCGGPHLT